jgi:hypothetical protein
MVVEAGKERFLQASNLKAGIQSSNHEAGARGHRHQGQTLG